MYVIKNRDYSDYIGLICRKFPSDGLDKKNYYGILCEKESATRFVIKKDCQKVINFLGKSDMSWAQWEWDIIKL